MSNINILEQAKLRAISWLDDIYDLDTRQKVQNLLDSDNEKELVNAFYRELEFGTGGLRGIMDVGTNRINIYTIGAATQGFANYINKIHKGSSIPSVCVGYDCRNNSKLFAETVATVFSANGIHTYIFETLRPTPEVSFAIRELNCTGGVIITASHNPKEYNGYKAYWSDGGQLVRPYDKDVIDEVKKVAIKDIKFLKNDKLITILGDDMDCLYLEQVKTVMLSEDVVKRQHDLKIVFSPLHGTTYRLVPESLRYWGFTNVITVESQMTPDGDFPTVYSANPEEDDAFTLALQKAKQVDADIVMACDPDGDRIGIAVKDDKNSWVLLNGNQTNCLLLDYIINTRRELGLIPKNAYTVKTIVTSELIGQIATKNDIVCHDVYTGFKWIADKIGEVGADGYIGAGEESYGFMPGTFTRDKDAVATASLLAEIAAWAKDNNKTLFSYLKEINVIYGFSQERLVYLVKEGLDGANEINEMMSKLRYNTPTHFAGKLVASKKDYLTLTSENFLTGNIVPLEGFPTTSNVLQFYLEDGSKISVRPSGTEPKIKFYFEIRADLKDINTYDIIKEAANKMIDKICIDLEISK